MADILLRGVPDDLHARIKERATAAGRSVNDLLVSEVIAWADRPTIDEWLIEIDGGRRRDGPSASEVVDLIRRDRDAR